MGPGAHSLLSSGQKSVLEAQLLSDAQDRHRFTGFDGPGQGSPHITPPPRPPCAVCRELTFFPRERPPLLHANPVMGEVGPRARPW